MKTVTLSLFSEVLSVSYLDEGQGPLVLLLHGWGARAETYRLLFSMLTPHFRVIAPDMPGFGSSTEPKVPYDTAMYAAFVRAFAEALGIEKAILIGHSHGGRTILRLLSDEKPLFAVPKAVLFDAAGLIRQKSPSEKRKIRKFKILKKLFGTKLLQKLLPNALEKLRQKTGSADYAAASPVMRQSLVKVINEDLRDDLPRIAVPVLLIWGDRDTATPLSDGKIMAEKIPDCGLVVIPGGDHFSFLQNPDMTRRVLDSFLRTP